MSGYEQDVDQALDLVAESEGPDQWAIPTTVPEIVDSTMTPRRHPAEAAIAAAREHERELVAQRVQTWLRGEGLGAMLGHPLGDELLAVIRRG